MNTFPAEELRKWRLENLWTQRELAEKIGVSSTVISRWEAKTAVPRLANQQRLRELRFPPVAKQA